MIYPKKLTDGIIGVTACSDGRTDELDVIRVKQGIKTLMHRGVKTRMTEDVFTGEGGRSAEAKKRAEEFMGLVLDPEVQAVVQVCGGDYLCEVLPYLDYEAIAKNPKWHQGFSDPTGILYSITTLCDTATIYGGNFSDFGMEIWHESLEKNWKVLNGEAFASEDACFAQGSYEKYQAGFTEKVTGLEGFELTEEVVWKAVDADGREVASTSITGRQLGGCLDILGDLLGTPYEKTAEFAERYKEDGIVWCLESFELGAAALTRTLWRMKAAGWFRYAKGFVFGRPTFFREDYGFQYQEAVLQALADLQVPLIFDADFGHRPPRIPLVLGAMAEWTVKDHKGEVKQWLK